jgi:hypothetical protein
LPFATRPSEPGAEHTHSVLQNAVRSPAKHARRRPSICSREMRHARGVEHCARVDVLAGRLACASIVLRQVMPRLENRNESTIAAALDRAARAAEQATRLSIMNIRTYSRRALTRAEPRARRDTAATRFGPLASVRRGARAPVKARGARTPHAAPRRQNAGDGAKMRRSAAATETPRSRAKSLAKKSPRRKSIDRTSPAGWFCCQTGYE